MSTRTSCGSCGGGALDAFLDLGKTPLANTLPATAHTAETWYPLGLCRCESCGLVQNIETVPDDEIYNEGYAYYSGGSSAQRAYHQASADMLRARHGDVAANGVVEIACNDGSLLKHFLTDGYRVLGVDPARPADDAIAAGIPVRKEPFTASLGRTIRDEHGPQGLVIAYNVLAHVENLGDVIQGIWELLAENGVAVVEMQYLPDLITGNLVGQIYHEHRYYHSLTSFQHAALLHGLHVIDAELIEFQNGGIRVTLSPNPTVVATQRTDSILDSEAWLNDPASFTSMQGRIDRVGAHARSIIANEQRRPGTIVSGYAAAAKATTIINYFQLAFPFIADSTPYKQGRFLPGIEIPIISPEQGEQLERRNGSASRVLLSSNFLAHLLRTDTGFLRRNGRWVIIEPNPMVI